LGSYHLANRFAEQVRLRHGAECLVEGRRRLTFTQVDQQAGSLAAALADLGLAAGDRIHFLGARRHDTLPACYQAADLFLFASETETQGLVLAEAAACGLPAVAVDAPGCDEVVRDGATGVLTKGSAAALADAAIGLLLDPAQRRAMGVRARDVAVRGFAIGLQIDRTLEVYEKLR